MNVARITCKDLLVLWRDRRALVMLITMPLVFIAIIGLSTGQLLGWRNKNEQLKIVVMNQDGGSLSQQIVERLKARPGLAVTELEDRKAADALLDEGKHAAIVVIGNEFQDRVNELRPTDGMDFNRGRLAGGPGALDIEIVGRPSFTNASSVVEMVVQGEALRVVVPVALRKHALIRNLMDRRREEDAVAEAETPGTPKVVSTQPLESGGNVVYQKIVPSYTVLFTFFLIMIMARSFLAEKELGTLERLRSTPATNVSLLFGKTIPFYFVSLVQGALLFLTGRVLFGMSWGPRPEWLAVVIAATSLSATGLGLLIATLVRTDSQVSSLGPFVVITMAGISGCFMPREWLPEGMQQLSLATPHAWALMAYDQLLATPRPRIDRVAWYSVILVGFSMGFFVLGWLRFRRAD